MEAPAAILLYPILRKTPSSQRPAASSDSPAEVPDGPLPAADNPHPRAGRSGWTIPLPPLSLMRYRLTFRKKPCWWIYPRWKGGFISLTGELWSILWRIRMRFPSEPVFCQKGLRDRSWPAARSRAMPTRSIWDGFSEREHRSPTRCLCFWEWSGMNWIISAYHHDFSLCRVLGASILFKLVRIRTAFSRISSRTFYYKRFLKCFTPKQC